MSKPEALAAMTRIATTMPERFTREDGITALLVIFYDWFAAHPQQVAMTEIVAAWDAGRQEGA
jgi:hypothetical protein